MTAHKILTILAMIVGASLMTSPAPLVSANEETKKTWDFEDTAVGQLPEGWKVEGTNQRGPVATWQVITDESTPIGEKVLALTNSNHESGSTFNICWTHTVSFLNGEIEVRFKANTGEEDQGGSVIWRAKDKDNYYIARFNPLEDNFRIYYVKDGARKMRASVRIKLPAGVWHQMKITHYGDKIEGHLNGKKLLEVTDRTFTKSGGVGLWTKADAVTSFDDLSVQVR